MKDGYKKKLLIIKMEFVEFFKRRRDYINSILVDISSRIDFNNKRK